MKLCVIGQGYVGLPLALSAAKSGFDVTGLDNDSEKVSQITAGISPVEDITNEELGTALKSGNYKVSADLTFDSDVKVICICVPTPLGSDHKPDLSSLKAAIIIAGKSLKPGMLVIVESTISPGTTRQLLLPILLENSGLSVEKIGRAHV